MILRKFDDADLIAEMRARGFVVLRCGDLRQIEANTSTGLFDVQRARQFDPTGGSYVRHIYETLAARIGGELLRGPALTISTEEKPADLLIRYAASLMLVVPQAAAHVNAPELAPTYPVPPKRTDVRPANCRNRLSAEGKPHPKSGCTVAGCGGVFGVRVCQDGGLGR